MRLHCGHARQCLPISAIGKASYTAHDGVFGRFRTVNFVA